MPQQTIQLSSNWEFKSDKDSTWRPVSQVPSNIHTELQHHGLIPDPFLDLNALEVDWVAERKWIYRTHFATPTLSNDEGPINTHFIKIDLVLEGLDTFADVVLNGEHVLQSDNMFIEHRLRDIGSRLHPHDTNNSGGSNNNTLEITFHPATQRGRELVAAHPEHEFIVHQTEVARGPVRKAQYHWGWDWGPILVTCGPWKPVRLEVYAGVKVENVRVDYEVSLQDRDSVVEAVVHADVWGARGEVEAQVEVLLRGKRVVLMREQFDGGSVDGSSSSCREYSSQSFAIRNPKLWWPRGHGPQNLYEVRVRIVASDGSTVLGEAPHQLVGFRKAELIQAKDGFGQSFYFRVNGVDIFSGGSCWVPADSFLPQIPAQRYRDWIQLLAEGNQNMIRVWGGGVYEPDVFYEACDELGILVWQDFMFACASYPTYPEFLASVTAEVRSNVRRLRHHPSIILWCGNNEDYQLVERYNLEYNFESDKDPDSWLKSTFPARYIYENLLPSLLAEECPPFPFSSSQPSPPSLWPRSSALYHPSSPWGNGTSTTLAVDSTVGDIHQWNLWNGPAQPWQKLADMGGRFISEFGFVGYPHTSTIRKFVTDSAERYAGSRTMDFHNKAVVQERRLWTYIGENFRAEWAGKREGDGTVGFAHLTQVIQADALGAGYKLWRKGWGVGSSPDGPEGTGTETDTTTTRKPKGRQCGGVLVWQLNDCWPVVSWAIADYYLVKKPAFYAIKRALAPLAVGVSRKFHDWTTRPADALWRRDTGHVDLRKMLTDIEFDVWVSSSRLDTVDGKVVVRFVSVKTGKDIREKLEKPVQVRANGCTEVLEKFAFDWKDASVAEPEHFVIQAALWVDGVRVSSDVSWPDPLKYLDFADRGVKVKHSEGQGTVEVSAMKPVKGFVFAEEEGVKLSDNGFDLIPGDGPVLVKLEGATHELSWTFVGR
ncbi:glycoside hydrolase family 2 protein [Chaetomium sp. MPI-SDFR-AT-0129]|nr:glycoside hydrolase family 2 protein [Chaetomium sp. MPI-SDFR-AT-0129]